MFACSITGRVVGSDDLMLETNFIFDEARPFEVRLQNVTGDDVVFARELLADALNQGATGEGWVRLHVAADRFLIRFGYDIPVGYLAYPLADVSEFHQKTYDVVPWGVEAIDFDVLLDQFNEDKI